MSFPSFASGEVLTAADMNAVGLWKVASGTLSLSTTPTQVTSVFNNANFPNYKLLITTTARSTSNKMLLKFILGTTPDSSAYYAGGIGASSSSNTTLYFERSNNATSLSLQKASSAANAMVGMEIIAPNQAIPTMYSGFFMETNDVDAYTFGGGHNVGTAYNGFELFTSSGTQTVTYQLYGYRA